MDAARGARSNRRPSLISPEELEALSRTARLIRLDVFNTEPASEAAIAAGLRATTIRIVADRSVAATRSGQTAIATLYMQLAMSGLLIDLDVPNAELVAPQPPLKSDLLVDAMTEYSDDLMPGGSSTASGRASLVIAIGDTPVVGPHVRISWTDDAGFVVPGSDEVPSPSGNALPFGAIAAAAAVAAEGVRAAMAEIAERLERPVPENSRWTALGARSVCVELGPLLVGLNADLGELDVISGGAITNALIYCLMRVPDLRTSMRIVDDDLLDASNLNRYSMARRSQVGTRKTSILTSYTTEAFELIGEPLRLESSTVGVLEPFRSKVVVGVDDIPSRWLAQGVALDRAVCVAATSHDFVLVTTHAPGRACAGCAHPRDEPSNGPIPTIGFVSLWAGLMQAVHLVARPEGTAGAMAVHPLGLENPRGIRRYTQAPHSACPVQCPASAE